MPRHGGQPPVSVLVFHACQTQTGSPVHYRVCQASSQAHDLPPVSSPHFARRTHSAFFFLCEEKECESQKLWLGLGPVCSPEDFALLNSPIHTCDNGRGRAQRQVPGRWHLCPVSAFLFSPPFLPGGESLESTRERGYQGKLLEDVTFISSTPSLRVWLQPDPLGLDSAC